MKFIFCLFSRAILGITPWIQFIYRNLIFLTSFLSHFMLLNLLENEGKIYTTLSTYRDHFSMITTRRRKIIATKTKNKTLAGSRDHLLSPNLTWPLQLDIIHLRRENLSKSPQNFHLTYRLYIKPSKAPSISLNPRVNNQVPMYPLAHTHLKYCTYSAGNFNIQFLIFRSP